jgi:hypothetical protein
VGITNSNFTGNSYVNGSLIYQFGSFGRVEISGSTFSNNSNTVDQIGSVNLVYGGQGVFVTNSTFSHNNTPGSVIYGSGATITGSTFDSNTSPGLSRILIFVNTNATITSSNFIGNSGLVLDVSSTATVNGSTFSNNAGGAIYAAHASNQQVNILNSVFTGNGAGFPSDSPIKSREI